MKIHWSNIPKSLSEAELQSYLDWIRQQIQGSQLQDVRTDGRILVLDLYGKGPWALSLLPEIAKPHLLLTPEDQAPDIVKSPKPVQLFLKAHAKNLALGELTINTQVGRQVELLFLNRHKELKVIFNLVPHFANIQVFSDGKSISWYKTKETPPKPEGSSVVQAAENPDWSLWPERFFKSVLESSEGTRSAERKENSADATDVQVQKDLLKKEGALQKLKSSLENSDQAKWQTLGELLKVSSDHSTDLANQLPEDLKELFDARISISENRDRAFTKSKDLKRKKLGTLERIQILETQIAKLKSGDIQKPAAKLGTRAMVKSGSKGQTLNLESGLQAVVGRSAQDNMAILRQARAWDLWLHLKDEPSAHAVIFREKNQKVTDGDIRQVAQWILDKSKLGKESRRSFKYEVLVVECRFVKPLKGDKAGRVTYTHPQVYSFASKPNP